MDYLSFDLRLGEWNPTQRTGVAEVLQSPAGESERYDFELDLDIDQHAGRRGRSAAMAAELGRILAESALNQSSLTLWHESYQIARERNRRLRLRLHIESWDLGRLPWELLYDARRGDFLVFDPMVSLVRYVRLHAAPPTPRQAGPLRVLAAIASPRDQLRLDWEDELGYLYDALMELDDAGQVCFSVCENATHEKLHLALLDHTPDVIHFIGHAEYDEEKHLGFLALEDEEGRSAPLPAADAARMFRRYHTNLVVLNACQTAQGAWAGLAPALVRAEIPAVVAMQWPVEDRTAICFSRSFYKALALGKSVDECVSEGRLGASAVSSDPNDWASPVLFLRSVNGQLWTSTIDARQKRPRQTPVATHELTRTATSPDQETAMMEDGGIHFKTRGPLLSPAEEELIVDRRELRRALRIAQQPSVTQYMAFLSARQTGKTTLLLRLMSLLQDQYACVFIDLSVLSAQDARACFRFVAFRLVSELRALLGDEFTPPEARQMESSVDLLEFLREVADRVPMSRIILLMDEVGALSPEVSDTFFNTLRTLFTQGRGLSNQLAKYLFIFSGAVDLYTLTFGTSSPLNICEKIYLRDFDREDTAKIVRQFESLGVPVAPEALDAIYDLTGGHPYLTNRLCALMEEDAVSEVSVREVERAAEEILIEDDNIRHVIHELQRRPLERRRLRSILIEGRKIPFSRNDPVLASLEMIGAIRPTQPCTVRNHLYERALRAYFETADGDTYAGSAADELFDERDEMYARLRALRAEALDERGRYTGGKSWQTFVAALYSLVPAFSIHPLMNADRDRTGVMLSVDEEAGEYWETYRPAVRVECCDLTRTSATELVAQIAERTEEDDTQLAFVIATGAREGDQEAISQARRQGQPHVVLIADEELVTLLEEHGDLDEFLRNRVLQARLYEG